MMLHAACISAFAWHWSALPCIVANECGAAMDGTGFFFDGPSLNGTVEDIDRLYLASDVSTCMMMMR